MKEYIKGQSIGPMEIYINSITYNAYGVYNVQSQANPISHAISILASVL